MSKFFTAFSWMLIQLHDERDCPVWFSIFAFGLAYLQLKLAFDRGGMEGLKKCSFREAG